MKISKLTIISFATFFAFFIYTSLIQAGLCIDSSAFWCGYSMNDITRYQYLLLTFTATSLIVDLFFKNYKKTWWKYSFIAVPISVVFIFLINIGYFHTNTAGSGGWGDIFNKAFDNFFAIINYAVFSIGSLVAIVIGRKKNK